MTLGPVVAGARLTKDEVVRPEELPEGTRADRVHGAGLQVDEDCTWNVLATGRLIVVDVDALELQLGCAVVRASGVDSVLVGDDLPELTVGVEREMLSRYLEGPWGRKDLLLHAHFGADLVAALAGLDVNDFPHGVRVQEGFNFWEKVKLERKIRWLRLSSRLGLPTVIEERESGRGQSGCARREQRGGEEAGRPRGCCPHQAEE